MTRNRHEQGRSGHRSADRATLSNTFISRRQFAIGVAATIGLGPTLQPSRRSWTQELSEEFADRVERAYSYMSHALDLWTDGTVVFDEPDSGAAAFYPAFIGDHARLSLITRDANCDRTESLEIRLSARLDNEPQGWAGVMWLYPHRDGGNWGEVAGRSVEGARRIRFRAKGRRGGEIVEFIAGGVNRAPRHHANLDYQDTLDEIRRRICLTDKWKEYELALPSGADLSGVISGFGVVVGDVYNTVECCFELDGIRYDNRTLAAPRLIRSYESTRSADDDPYRSAAYTYDNALALLAFLARGQEDDRRSAELLADSLTVAIQHDRYYAREPDGLRWRNAYSCGPLLDPDTGSARLPGWTGHSGQSHECNPRETVWLEDMYTVGCDVGNNAWAMIALLSAHSMLRPGSVGSPWLTAARACADWVERYRRTDRWGGYAGGFDGWPDSKDCSGDYEWRSTEHNLDLYVAFSKLAAFEEQPWRGRAAHARKFVEKMWNGVEHHFWTGTLPPQKSPRINDSVRPLDAQTWAVLALEHESEWLRHFDADGLPSFIRWVEKSCAVRGSDGTLLGYRFSQEGHGVWNEGTAQMATVYRRQGCGDAAFLLRVIAANSEVNAMNGGEVLELHNAIYATPEPDGAHTGFAKPFTCKGPEEPWIYPRRRHLGATAWFLFAALGKNPYWLER